MKPSSDEAIEHQSARLRQLLASGPVILSSCGMPGRIMLGNVKGRILVRAEVLRELAAKGLVTRCGNEISLAAQAKIIAAKSIDTGAARQDIETVMVESDGVRTEVKLNLAESPLGQLMLRRGKDGQPFLTQAEFESGERLRFDYTRGRIMPRLGANWEAGVSSGRRGEGIAELTDASLAARQRVDRALAAVGPELSGTLVDVCCFLKGLETVERERSWPVRSAKVILKAALSALARHYRPPVLGKPAQALHWGADDYRPRID